MAGRDQLRVVCDQLIAFFEDISETYPEEKDLKVKVPRMAPPAAAPLRPRPRAGRAAPSSRGRPPSALPPARLSRSSRGRPSTPPPRAGAGTGSISAQGLHPKKRPAARGRRRRPPRASARRGRGRRSRAAALAEGRGGLSPSLLSMWRVLLAAWRPQRPSEMPLLLLLQLLLRLPRRRRRRRLISPSLLFRRLLLRPSSAAPRAAGGAS